MTCMSLGNDSPDAFFTGLFRESIISGATQWIDLSPHTDKKLLSGPA